MIRTVVISVFCVLLTGVGSAFGQSPRTTPVAVGDMAPDFSLESHTGEKVSLSAARGKSPVVLVFYRGYW